MKNTLAPTGKREAVDYLVGEEHHPIRVAYYAISLALAAFYNNPAGLKEQVQPIIDALNKVAGKHDH